MRKVPRVSRLGDYLHRGFVVTCAAVTLFATMDLGLRVYNYYSVIKPQRDREEKLRMAEEKTSAAEADMTDSAQTLRV